MKTWAVTLYGIVAAGALLVSSGCHEWNRHGDRDGYYRDGGRYERRDRWGNEDYRDRRYSWPDRRDRDWDRN